MSTFRIIWRKSLHACWRTLHETRRGDSLVRLVSNNRFSDLTGSACRQFDDSDVSTSHIAVYPVNLCPIQSNGAASHSRPRRTILHYETADGKRYLCHLIDNLCGFVQERASCTSRVRQVERKKNKSLSA